MSTFSKLALAAFVVVLLAAAGLYFLMPRPPAVVTTPPAGVACTQEAKLCPDGSYVSRQGPNCDFAACPVAPATTGTMKLGGTATIGATQITVLDLLEDSRCPVDVQCIQAGTVRVRAAVGSMNRDFTFTLAVPQTIGDQTITLVSVIPGEKNSKQPIAPSDYRFTFSVTPLKNPATSTSGVQGTVSLGPTCPVMRDPPDPGCADKGYATTISIYHTGSSALVASTKSDANGAYKVTLPPGSYTVSAGGGATLPRCGSVNASVTTTGYVTANISCDTGIR